MAWLIVTAFLVATVGQWLPLPWLLPAILWLPATGWFWWRYEDWANDLYIVTNDKVIVSKLNRSASAHSVARLAWIAFRT
ncbi:MAG: hypothetical protein IPO15_13490 [Anaerolineae bacterium]|uniref:hypothetical protein n=1 Tax=Candidatus Amarolinea dominans TaxID=3140696 RepID=UPI003136DF92|nr:hypothetical protein [Anaerolineae bacterium]